MGVKLDKTTDPTILLIYIIILLIRIISIIDMTFYVSTNAVGAKAHTNINNKDMRVFIGS